MNKIRILLVGLVMGGGIGAKIGAYISALSVDDISWSFVEWGAGIGIAVGCSISVAIILMKSRAFEKTQKQAVESTRRIAPSSI